MAAVKKEAMSAREERPDGSTNERAMSQKTSVRRSHSGSEENNPRAST